MDHLCYNLTHNLTNDASLPLILIHVEIKDPKIIYPYQFPKKLVRKQGICCHYRRDLRAINHHSTF